MELELGECPEWECDWSEREELERQEEQQIQERHRWRLAAARGGPPGASSSSSAHRPRESLTTVEALENQSMLIAECKSLADRIGWEAHVCLEARPGCRNNVPELSTKLYSKLEELFALCTSKSGAPGG